MTHSPPRAVVIIDLLSHQGVVDPTPFRLAHQALSFCSPQNLFIFADLSPLATGLQPPAHPSLTATERLVHTLGPHGEAAGPGTFKRGPDRRGLPYLPRLLQASGDWDPGSDLAALVEFALLPSGPGHAQCRLGALADCEELMEALPLWLSSVVAPRVQGCAVLCVLYTHGGYGRVHSRCGGRGRGMSAPAISAIPSRRPEQEPENLSMEWVADRLVLPLAQAVGQAGALTWLQSSCYAPDLLRSLAGAITARTGVAPQACFPSSSSSQSSASAPSSQGGAAKRAKLTAHPKLVLMGEKPLYSPWQDVRTLFGLYEQSSVLYSTASSPLPALLAAIQPRLPARELGGGWGSSGGGEVPLWVMAMAAEAATPTTPGLQAALAAAAAAAGAVAGAATAPSSAAAAAAPPLPTLKAVLAAFSQQVLAHLCAIDHMCAWEAVAGERHRAAVAGEVWWWAEGGVQQCARTPPPPTPARPAKRSWSRDQLEALRKLLWEPEKKGFLSERAPLPLLQLYQGASAAAAGAGQSPAEQQQRSKEEEEREDAELCPRAYLQACLNSTADALTAAWQSATRLPAADAGGATTTHAAAAARVLAAASAQWAASPAATYPAATPGAPSFLPAYSLTTALACLEEAIQAECAAAGGGCAEGSGGASSCAGAATAASDCSPDAAPLPAAAPSPPLPWHFASPLAASLFAATLLPLLHSLPFPAALPAHEPALHQATLRLAAARVIAAPEAVAGAGSPHPHPHPLQGWTPSHLFKDATPPSPFATPCQLPHAYAVALARSGAEVSAARWPGALRKLGEVVAATAKEGWSASASASAAAAAAGHSGQGGLGWGGAWAMASCLDALLRLCALGDMSSKFDVGGVMRGLQRGWVLGQLEEHCSSGCTVEGTHRRVGRKELGVRDSAGNLCETPVPSPHPVPLLSLQAVGGLLGAQRVGGVYAWGVAEEALV